MRRIIKFRVESLELRVSWKVESLKLLTAYCLKGFKKFKSLRVQGFKKFAHQARRPFPSVRQQEVQGRISERGSGLFALISFSKQ